MSKTSILATPSSSFFWPPGVAGVAMLKGLALANLDVEKGEKGFQAVTGGDALCKCGL